MQLINIVLFWLLLGLLAAHFSKKRGRSPLVWFAIGMFLGFFGLLLLFALPKVKKEIETSSSPALRPSFPKQSELWLKMWYYLDSSHTQQGPFEFPDLINKWKEKGISEHSFVWGEGMAKWSRLSDLPDLIQEFEKNYN